MNFIQNKKIVFFFVLVVIVSFFAKTVFAVWSGTFYEPGDTLDPECLPSQVDCDVRAPLTSLNISNTVYGVSWDGVTTIAPSKDAIYDKIEALSAASGTVTSVSVTTANGVSGSVATATSTPAITLTLGAITPTTVNGITFSGSATPTLAVTGTTTVSGTNTGDQTTITGNAGTATALAANGANCSAGSAPLGVDASGAAESCFDVWTEAENTSAGYLTSSTGANAALSNLASVAINTSLISDTDSTDDLGSTASAWANLYVDNIKSITGNALTLEPIAGSNLNINLSTTGDFAVNTDDLYVDTSAGNVGIGTASPNNRLDISGDADNNSYVEVTNTNGTPVRFIFGTTGTLGSGFAGTIGAHPFDFRTDNTARLTILPTSGNVGISTSAPQSLLDVQGPTGTGTATAGILTLATKELTIVDGDELGRINFNAPLESDGTDSRLAGAAIWAEADATFSATVNTTDLVFATGASEAATEKMRLTSGGALQIAGLTASELVATDASKNLVSLAVGTYPSLTEISYVKGVTSAVQTQLNAKQATISFGTGAETALGVNVGTDGAFVVKGGALGTPSSGVATNLTGLPAAAVLAGTFGTGAYTMDTSLTVPTILGGTGTTSDLNLKTTSGVGDTGADMHFLVGNNGATEAMTILNNGNVGIGDTTPGVKLQVADATSRTTIVDNNGQLRIDGLAVDGEIRSILFGDVGGNPIAKISVERNTAGSRFHFGTSVNYAAGITSNVMTLLQNGSLGISTTAPDKKLEINLGTTDALRLTYNDANGSAATYMDTTLASDGGVTFTGAGSSPDFTFAQAVNASSFVGALTGNASTATALAANGADCSAGSAPLGVDASGAVESCTDFEEDLSNSAGLLAALSDETGTGVAVFNTAPAFTTSISTPSIITASGALGITPAAGSNLNINLATTGDLAVNTDDLYVDTSSGNVGIGTASALDARLAVIGGYFATDGNRLGDPTDNPSTNAGLLWSFNATNLTTNSYGVGLGAARNAAYDIWFRTGNTNGGGYRWYIGDNEKVTIDKNGNLGINTTAPQSLLDVQGPVGTGTATAGILTLATKELTIVDGDELGRINFNAPLESDGTDAILAGAAIWAEADDTFSATVNSSELVFGTATTSAAVERMRIDSAGNVGIGTATPATALSIYRSGADLPSLRLEDGDISIPDYSSTGFNPALTTNTIGQFLALGSSIGGVQFQGFSNTSDERALAFVGHSGKTSPTANSVVSFQAWKHDGGTDRTALTGSDIAFDFNSGATNLLRILGGGNVGIGLTSPLLKLDVAGSGRFTGTATSVLTGSIDPAASTTVTGVSTLFTTELVVGDRITVTGETRTVTAIASNTSLTVDTAFSNNANDTSPDKLPAIFVARDSGGTVQMYMNDAGLLSVNNLETGPLNFDENAGAISWVDMSVTSAAIDNTVQSYSAQIDGSPVLTIYGLSDGAGGVDTLRVGIGDTTPDFRLDVEQDIASTFAAYFFHDGNNANRWGIGIQAGADDNAGTNTMVEWFDGDATSIGSITSSGGTVTYGAFTANHDVTLPEADNLKGYPYGTLVCIDRAYVTPDSPRGVKYDAKMCDGVPYDARVLGAYAGKYENKPNLHQVYVLGDGQIIVNGEGGDIKVGDRIATSSVAGEGMKVLKSGVSIATAQENYTFKDPKETKLLAVQYGLINNKLSETLTLEGLDARVKALEIGSSSGGIIGLVQSAWDSVLTKVENGFAYMRGLVVETLKVGSPTKRSGITLYDEVTGEAYCLSIANGTTKTTSGECGVVVTTPPAETSGEEDTTTPPDPVVEDDGNSEPEPEPVTEEDMTTPPPAEAGEEEGSNSEPQPEPVVEEGGNSEPVSTPEPVAEVSVE